MVPIGMYNTYKLNWTHVDYFLDWLEFLFRQLLSLYMKKKPNIYLWYYLLKIILQ